jgi:hypothetical protein
MGMLSEDIEDQSRAVDQLNFLPQNFLQLALVAGGEFIVEQNDVCRGLSDTPGNLPHLARSDESSWMRMFKPLYFMPHNHHTSRPRQLSQLGQ